jgi:hypothetical protein
MSTLEAFLQFDTAHPEIFAELVRRAREVTTQGKTRIGIRFLWERMRWYFEFKH